MIGIICAMPDEASAVHALCSHVERPSADLAIGRLDRHDVAIASCGLGKVRAALTASLMMERWQCRALVSAGTAGGLDQGLEPHDVVIALGLIQHDYGRSLDGGRFEVYRPGELPLPANRDKPIELRLDEDKARRFRELTTGLAFVRFGTYASGDTFVNDVDTRNRLIRLGAVAVDMESAAVVQVAEHYRVPWLVAKGVSDDASSTSHEAFLEGLAEASHRSAAVVQALLGALADDPSSLPA